MISDISYGYASPLVIVREKDGEICMAVGYREVNMQLESTARQLYQPTLFQMIGGRRFYAKVDNLWRYRQLHLTEDSSKVTTIITSWGYGFLV